MERFIRVRYWTAKLPQLMGITTNEKRQKGGER